MGDDQNILALIGGGGQSLQVPTGDPAGIGSKRKRGGMSPLAMLSPMAFMMAQNPEIGLSMLSPGAGLLSALGAFK